MISSIQTIEMHTGGEPLRIITGGVPVPEGRTLLEKRAFLRDQADQYRRFLMFEPRGHKDMYGALLVPPDHPDADLAVIFIHNEGYSTMCGHAIMALGRYALDFGLVVKGPEETTVKIQCPCGLVTANVDTHEGITGRVSFESVPAFAYKLGQFVETREYGPVEVDIGYGGAFYGILNAASLGLDVLNSKTRDLAAAVTIVSTAIKEQIEITHPEEPDLGYLYGTILTDGELGNERKPSANICVFADEQVDRSPTGSGVTARMAIASARKVIGTGEICQFKSVTGAVFTGQLKSISKLGPFNAVTVEVAGHSYYTGSAEFTFEDGDPLGGGFLLD
ncbi:proline racemase family protein [uncultured Sneathiella sp.]|uniref:proline racemase family protein n=1 Tax=uncultured Sneathiella sp. TaxID=879315 RepID=UPI0030DB1E49|tara:strand:+ start:1223 stop:2227 length:1005 start_codon:yes stop_codon:yes gene_type:complete